MSDDQKIDDGGPAFPYPPSKDSIFVQPPLSRGMTLRDYFAAKAMAAEIATWSAGLSSGALDQIATASYRMSDAMLRARKA